MKNTKKVQYNDWVQTAGLIPGWKKCTIILLQVCITFYLIGLLKVSWIFITLKQNISFMKHRATRILALQTSPMSGSGARTVFFQRIMQWRDTYTFLHLLYECIKQSTKKNANKIMHSPRWRSSALLREESLTTVFTVTAIQNLKRHEMKGSAQFAAVSVTESIKWTFIIDVV